MSILWPNTIQNYKFKIIVYICVCGGRRCASGGQKSHIPLELEFQEGEHPDIGAGNQTHVPRKSSNGSSHLNHLASPQTHKLNQKTLRFSFQCHCVVFRCELSGWPHSVAMMEIWTHLQGPDHWWRVWIAGYYGNTGQVHKVAGRERLKAVLLWPEGTVRTWHSDQRDEGSCRAPKKREIHLELSLCGSLYE